MKRINFSLLMLTFTLFSIYKSSHSDDMNTPDISFHRSLNCLLVSQPAKIKPLNLTLGMNKLYTNIKGKNTDSDFSGWEYALLAQELHRNIDPRTSETTEMTM